MKTNLPKVQFITHQTQSYTYIQSAKIALQGGVKFIQLRMKNHTFEQVEETGIDLLALCSLNGATLILDDWTESVERVGCSGVHLGKEDMPIVEARKFLGKDKIIGATANTFADVVKGFESGATYIGLGPYRYTTTKANLSPILGLEGYEKIISQCVKENIDIPIYAIGGIRMEDLNPLHNCGVYGVAVSSLILESNKPQETAQEIVNNWK